MKIFSRNSLTTSIAALLICGQVYALPPDRATSVVLSTQVKNGKIVEVGVVSDKVMPWKANVAMQVSPNTLSQTPNANMRFDYIIYPTSKFFGDLTDAYVDAAQYDHAKIYRVDMDYPKRKVTEDVASRQAYASRYSSIEEGIEKAISTILKESGGKARIAIGSFYHPVYFSNEKAVAFYTLAAINEALDRKVQTKNSQVTLLCDGNAKLAESFKQIYQYYSAAARAAQNDATTNVISFKQQFTVESEINRQIETDFFLQHMDRFTTLGLYYGDGVKLNNFTLMSMILDKSIDNIAPQHVLKMIRETTEKMLATLGEPTDIVRVRVKQIAKEKFGNEKQAEAATQELMEILNKSFSVSRMGIYSTILDPNTHDLDIVKKAIEHVIKK